MKIHLIEKYFKKKKVEFDDSKAPVLTETEYLKKTIGLIDLCILVCEEDKVSIEVHEMYKKELQHRLDIITK